MVRLERRRAGNWRAVRDVAVRDGALDVRVRLPATRGTARYRVVVAARPGVRATTARVAPVDVYTLHTYAVRTRGHVTYPVERFTTTAAAIYADQRGWRAAHHRFRRVADGGDLTLVLAQARTMPSFSASCSVRYSAGWGGTSW
ncbi:hypothetical protein GCM10025868_32610 [Angustibacter aerolatus]|uniref:Uncharacterized protein n=1 Tax=Angustibacter aerolatus TaxID=1162965 RepID=A0ABQ6JMR7_9ACTN|nr:hypothetical protein [Angustibacter aerolatus]GMA88011.1 hypothetical protein GCM10025868_32610 [Angustibacter aerolatus]